METMSLISSVTQFVKSLYSYNEEESKLLQTEDDSELIKQHSKFQYFNVNGVSMKLNVFNSPHPKIEKFNGTVELPVLVFIHGLGGQLSQFDSLMNRVSNFSELLAVDLPGCGKSEYINDWKIYEMDFLVDIIYKVIRTTLKPTVPSSETGERKVVLIGHSMGCILAAKLALRLKSQCLGVTAICPPLSSGSHSQVPSSEPATKALEEVLNTDNTQKAANRDRVIKHIILQAMPTFVFNMFRSYDRMGGPYSASVNRMVDSSASKELRLKQLRWNLQVNSYAWMKMAYYVEPTTKEEWLSVVTDTISPGPLPILLIGGEKDQITPVDNVHIIADWIREKYIEPIPPIVVRSAGHMCMAEKPEFVAGVISRFLSSHIDEKLSAGWQLSYLSQYNPKNKFTGRGTNENDKWSLKNEAKWKAVDPVSNVIEGSFFRAMKTLRESDSVHSPLIVLEKYPDIRDVIDISREAPPYDPKTFETGIEIKGDGGMVRHTITYHKFPTVSKILPTQEEVNGFINLVNEIRVSRGYPLFSQQKQQEPAVPSDPTPTLTNLSSASDSSNTIAVHCHYGFNRTGFFICSYLIQEQGMPVEQALNAFKKVRSPGIRHSHFINELYVRYGNK